MKKVRLSSVFMIVLLRLASYNRAAFIHMFASRIKMIPGIICE